MYDRARTPCSRRGPEGTRVRAGTPLSVWASVGGLQRGLSARDVADGVGRLGLPGGGGRGRLLRRFSRDQSFADGLPGGEQQRRLPDGQHRGRGEGVACPTRLPAPSAERGAARPPERTGRIRRRAASCFGPWRQPPTAWPQPRPGPASAVRSGGFCPCSSPLGTNLCAPGDGYAAGFAPEEAAARKSPPLRPGRSGREHGGVQRSRGSVRIKRVEELVALRPEGSPVLRGDGGRDGQPQAEAGLLPPGGVRPVKPLEKAAQLLRRDGRRRRCRWSR
jgi:hypothetical protein